MKVFRGDRTIDGVQVTVDDRRLPVQHGHKSFSENGFEWGYEGSEPRQLAFAILAEHLGDENAAAALADGFMRAIVANFGNEWEMSSADIDEALAAIRG